MSKKEITTTNTTAVALKELASEFSGAVTVRQELIKVSRLKLNQKMSAAVSDGLGKEGDFTIPVESKNYGNKITIIPLVVSESASLLFNVNNHPTIWNDNDSDKYVDGQVLCSSFDLIQNTNGDFCNRCPYGDYFNDWGTPEKRRKPKCRTSIDVVCLVDGEQSPVVLNFRSTSYPAGKSLINFIVKDPKGIPFANKYTLVSGPGVSNGFKHVKIEEGMVKTPLTDEELSVVIPIARQVLNAKKKGSIVHESEEASDIPV